MASVMAQSQTQPSLSIFDDSMEISSDAGRQVEDDIDIDIDVPLEDSHATNDDDMLDDNATETQDDDVMFDEETGTDNTQEQMEEDLLDFEDEELADVEFGADDDFLQNDLNHSRNDLQDPLGADSLNPSLRLDNANDAHTQSSLPQIDAVSFPQTYNGEDFEDNPEAEEMYSEPTNVVEDVEQSIIQADFNSEKSLGLTKSDLAENPSMTLEQSAGPNGSPTDETEPPIEQLSSEFNEGVQGFDQVTPAADTLEPSNVDPDVSLTNNHAVEAYPSATEVASNELLSMNKFSHFLDDNQASESAANSSAISQPHSVVVLWEEDEIPLFPLDDTSEFFLDNVSIVTSHISELFTAFRQVLGEAISDRSDLWIDFHDLDLIINEVGHTFTPTIVANTDWQQHASQNFLPTLADVIDIYLELHHNDGNTHPQPLRLSLTCRENPAIRFESLRHIAAEGGGISLVRTFDAEESSDSFDDNTDEHDAEKIYPSHVTADVENSNAENQSPGRRINGRDQDRSSIGENQFTAVAIDGEIPRESDGNTEEHEERRSANHTDSVHDVHVVEKGGDSNEETIVGEVHYEEDLLDDDDEGDDDYDEPTVYQEGLDGSANSSTIHGDDAEIHASASSANMEAIQSSQQSQKEMQDETGTLEHVQMDSWRTQQVADEDLEAETVLLAGIVGPQVPRDDNHPLNTSTSGHLGIQPDLEASNQVPDHSSSQDYTDVAYGRESENVSNTKEPDNAENSVDFHQIPEAGLHFDDETQYHQEVDIAEHHTDTQDDLDNAPDVEDEHQTFDFFGDISTAGKAQVDSTNREFVDDDGSDAIYEPPKYFGDLVQSEGFGIELTSDGHSNLASETPKSARKRSRNEQENSQYEVELGNGAKKARPS